VTADNAERLGNNTLVRYRGMVRAAASLLVVGAAAAAGASAAAHARQSTLASPATPAAAPQVQDMFNSEFYLGAYRDGAGGPWATTLCSDAFPAGGLPPNAETRIWERRPFYCVATPAESAWSAARCSGQPVAPATPQKTRALARVLPVCRRPPLRPPPPAALSAAPSLRR